MLTVTISKKGLDGRWFDYEIKQMIYGEYFHIIPYIRDVKVKMKRFGDKPVLLDCIFYRVEHILTTSNILDGLSCINEAIDLINRLKEMDVDWSYQVLLPDGLPPFFNEQLRQLQDILRTYEGGQYKRDKYENSGDKERIADKQEKLRQSLEKVVDYHKTVKTVNDKEG